MSIYYWIGKYESDIVHCDFFSGSITYYGSNRSNNHSFCDNSVRISSRLQNEYKFFVIQSMKKIIDNYETVIFLFYNQKFANEILVEHPEYISHVAGINSEKIIDLLNNKLYSRLLFSNIIDILPFKTLTQNECVYRKIQTLFPDYKKFIIQKNISSGGKGTFLLNAQSEEFIGHNLNNSEIYIVSPYLEYSYSVNSHICITDTNIILFPCSIQLSEVQNYQILYKGADYSAVQWIKDELKMEILNKLYAIGNLIMKQGYRGILGVDLLIFKDKVFFVEVNPRFQGSSLALNKCLIDQSLPSLYELHLMAYRGEISADIVASIKKLKTDYSLILYKKNTSNYSAENLYKNFKNNADLYEVFEDGYLPEIPIDFKAYMFRVLIKGNISYITLDSKINVVENLIDNIHFIFPLKTANDIIVLKISLLIRGVRLSESAIEYITQTSSIKNATFNSVDVLIYNDLKINCPVSIPFSELSPFYIDFDKLNNLCLYYKNSYVSHISVDTNENLLERKTHSGIPYSSIGFKTNDRVRIRHTAVCYFKEKGVSCNFCESKHKNKYNFSEDDIFEVIDAYEKEVNFRHYLIGGASAENDDEPERIKKIITHIRKISSKPIYLMSLPPKRVDDIYEYCQLGLNEISFNIEIFDRKIAGEIMPGKGKIPLEQYLNAFEASVKYLGSSGNVRSMLIVGLERKETLMKGIEKLCSIGVSPMLSIFRPMPKTVLKNVVPPNTYDIVNIYHEANEICQKYNLFLGPTCEQCQNNTLALPTYYSNLI